MRIDEKIDVPSMVGPVKMKNPDFEAWFGYRSIFPMLVQLLVLGMKSLISYQMSW